MRLDFFFCSQGVSALVSLVVFSVSGLRTLASDPTSPSDPGADNPPALQQTLTLLDQLRREQALLQEAIERLGVRQGWAFDQQARVLRDQRRDIAGSLLLQRDQEAEALQAVRRTTITAACIVAGLLLFAVAGIALNLIRVLQRISARVVHLPSTPAPFPRSGESGSSALLQARFAAALEQLERSLVNLEAAVVRVAPSQRAIGAVRHGNPAGAAATLPPRSQFRSVAAPVASVPVESLPGDFL